MLPVQLDVKREQRSAKKTFFASVNPAASLCIVKAASIPVEACTPTRKEQMATAGGVVDVIVYSGTVTMLDAQFDIEFIFSPIPNTLPLFQARTNLDINHTVSNFVH